MIVLHSVLLMLCFYGLYISVKGGSPFLAFLNTICAGFNMGMIVVYILDSVK